MSEWEIWAPGAIVNPSAVGNIRRGIYYIKKKKKSLQPISLVLTTGSQKPANLQLIHDNVFYKVTLYEIPF